MEKKKYYGCIKNIEDSLDKGEIDCETALEEVEKLYAYKPVSLKLQSLKCKILLKRGDAENVIKSYAESFSKNSKNEDNIELWEMLIDAYEKKGMQELARYNSYAKSRLKEDKNIEIFDSELASVKKCFVENEETLEILKKLENSYFETGNIIFAFCVNIYISVKYGKDKTSKLKYLGFANLAYFEERVQKQTPIIMIVERNNRYDYDIASYILSKMDVPVYIIDEAIEMDEEFSLMDSVKVSFDNMEKYEDCIVIPAISKVIDDKYLGDNIPYLVNEICKTMTSNDFAMIVTKNEMLEKLRIQQDLKKRFDRLSEYYADYLEDKVGFGWCGDYYEYIGLLYNEDVKKAVEKTPEVEFSIVIPVRNTSDTLLYTLQTCIEQEFDGKYEIVLSDNSVEGNTGVYDVYKKINNDRIKYYKTPRDLSLTKSFEYAFLKTCGKYIIPIGADDGIFPWTLRILHQVWEKSNEKVNILMWDRGFYAWPGFNGGQENQFVIPAFYEKNKINGVLNRAEDFLVTLKANPSAMYGIPNTYINSGFKREYMKVLYEKIGALWNGYSQDIYQGIANLSIETQILRLKYPLTIAGMSTSSTGAICNNVGNNSKDSHESYETLKGNRNLCQKIITKGEALIPYVGTDVAGMYRSIENFIQKGCITKEFYKGIDEIKTMFINCYQTLSIKNEKFEMLLIDGYEIAKKRGESLKKWYEECILGNLNRCEYFDSKEEEIRYKSKCYKEGFTDCGGMEIDASRFNVSNIYEATKLFKEFLKF